MQIVIFGVADPLTRIPDEGTRSLCYDQIAGLCALCAEHHLDLRWFTEGIVALPPTVAAPANLLGIQIAITEPDDEPIRVDDHLGALIDLRQLRGLTQALVDWQVVRLAASALGLELGDGRLFVVDPA